MEESRICESIEDRGDRLEAKDFGLGTTQNVESCGTHGGYKSVYEVVEVDGTKYWSLVDEIKLYDSR